METNCEEIKKIWKKVSWQKRQLGYWQMTCGKQFLENSKEIEEHQSKCTVATYILKDLSKATNFTKENHKDCIKLNEILMFKHGFEYAQWLENKGVGYSFGFFNGFIAGLERNLYHTMEMTQIILDHFVEWYAPDLWRSK